MTLFLQQIINGIMLGSVYSLVALGLTLIYGILHIPNFAHGHKYMFAAYVTFFLVSIFHFNYWVAIAGAMIPGTHQYAKDWADDLETYWNYKGGEVVAREPANYYGQTDFYPYLTKAIAAKPDVMFLCGPSDVCANIVKQGQQLGYKGSFLMCDQAKLSEMEYTVGLDAIEGSIGVIPLEQYKQMPWDRQQQWRESYRKRYNYVPTWEATCTMVPWKCFVGPCN